jgi:hypothetical protein
MATSYTLVVHFHKVAGNLTANTVTIPGFSNRDTAFGELKNILTGIDGLDPNRRHWWGGNEDNTEVYGYIATVE